MRKILIVDDEKNIREGLQSMIEREYNKQYDIHLASDAFEALELIQLSEFDVMLTDISMPEMDGIELIKSIRDSQHIDNKPYVVIVSGYDDFAYAKAAIHYEVKEYLLKPVIREELAKTIERMEEELQRKEELKKKLTSSNQQWEDFKESQLNFYSTHPSAEPEEVRGKLAQLNLDWLDNGFRIMIIKHAGDLQSIGIHLFRAQMEAKLDDALPSLPFRMIRFFNRVSHAVILVEGMQSFEYLADLLSSSDHQLILSVSGPNIGMEKLHVAYEEAALALKYSIMRSTPGLVLFDDISNKQAHYAVPTDKIRMVANMLGSGREKEMLKIVHEILDSNEISHYHIGYLETLSRTLNESVFDHVFQMYGQESVDLLKRYKAVGSLYNFTYLQEYSREVESLILLLNDYIKILKSSQMDNKEMKAALQYIHENYTKNINMTIISNVVSFNYSYFSQAFREYTGENFVNYLKKYRIGKAKELLETTEDKVLEIAKNVGFENIKNFNRVFKESEGVSPVEYRNQKKILLLPDTEMK